MVTLILFDCYLIIECVKRYESQEESWPGFIVLGELRDLDDLVVGRVLQRVAVDGDWQVHFWGEQDVLTDHSSVVNF